MKRIMMMLLALGCLWPAGTSLAAPTVTLNVVQIFGTIDPAKITDYTEYMAAVNLYDGLVTVDETGTIQPLLAASWDVSDDTKTFTFHLKPGATFHDGTPVTASDVVYSVKRLLAIDQGPSFLFRDILSPDAVTAPDDATVQMTLSEVFSPFMAALPLIFVVNQELVEANTQGDDWGQAYLTDHEAGSGPFTLESWTRGSEMRIARYDGYHLGWDENGLDDVRFVLTNDEATVRALAASGELSMTSEFQSSETYDALAKMDGFRIEERATGTAFLLKLNTQLAPTDDVHIRRAIACATDYDTIREVIYPGGVLKGPLPSAFGAFTLDTLEAPSFDLECAADEVAQSAYAGSGPIPLTLTYVAGTSFEEEIGLLMKSNLEQVGFALTLVPETWNRMTEIASEVATTPNINEVFFGATYPSPDSMFFTQYASDAAGTWASMSWLDDQEVDDLIAAGRATADAGEQVTIYKALQQRLVDLQPDVFLLEQTERHAMDTCLTGYEYVPMQSFGYNFHNYRWTCDD